MYRSGVSLQLVTTYPLTTAITELHYVLQTNALIAPIITDHGDFSLENHLFSCALFMPCRYYNDQKMEFSEKCI